MNGPGTARATVKSPATAANGTASNGAGRLRAAETPATRDIRAGSPNVLRALLGKDTWRRALRMVSLLAIDIGGVYLAIFSALGLKALVQGSNASHNISGNTLHFAPLACLVTVLLFARSEEPHV